MDPFATLGLLPRYDIDHNALEQSYRELQRKLHPDKHMGAAASERRAILGKAMEVNEAYRTLRDDLRRAEALIALHAGAGSVSEGEAADPELLMEIMELREALGEAKQQKDLEAARRLGARVQRERVSVREALVVAFASLADLADAAALARARALLGRLKYYQRFLDEVNVIEEEAELS